MIKKKEKNHNKQDMITCKFLIDLTIDYHRLDVAIGLPQRYSEQKMFLSFWTKSCKNSLEKDFIFCETGSLQVSFSIGLSLSLFLSLRF